MARSSAASPAPADKRVLLQPEPTLSSGASDTSEDSEVDEDDSDDEDSGGVGSSSTTVTIMLRGSAIP